MYVSHFPSTPHLEAYLQDGRITFPGETARDMINRIVGALAAADRHFDPAGANPFARRLGEALDDRRIVFSTPVMTNAGRHVSRPLAACAVPPAELGGDLSIVKGIIDDYHRAGMGTGFNLDGLDDPVTVLRYLNQVAVDGAASGTEDRPVGNMAILPLAHPHALEFIQCKAGADDRGEAWKFNISIQVTDVQMRAAGKAPCAERTLLAAAAEAAWDCGDPGVIFADRMDQANPTPQAGGYVSTAPCAEVGLTSGETCQFGYLNLGRFLTSAGTMRVNLDLLAETVVTLVRALDDAVEASLPCSSQGSQGRAPGPLAKPSGPPSPAGLPTLACSGTPPRSRFRRPAAVPRWSAHPLESSPCSASQTRTTQISSIRPPRPSSPVMGTMS